MAKTSLQFPEKIDLIHYISTEAHDLRSPFNRIVGFTKVILKGMDGPLTDLQKEDLNTVYINSLQALNALNDLIDAARLLLKEKEPSRKEIKIDALIGQAISHWQQQNPARQIHLRQETSLPSASLQGDEILLRQLLVHCITYIGTYLKDPAEISLQAEGGSETIRFTVRGTGKREETRQGSVLELLGYICRAILELHSGRILSGESDENGAIIQFELPS